MCRMSLIASCGAKPGQWVFERRVFRPGRIHWISDSGGGSWMGGSWGSGFFGCRALGFPALGFRADFCFFRAGRVFFAMSEHAVVWRTDIDRRRCRRYVDHTVDTAHFRSCGLRGLPDDDPDGVKRFLDGKSQGGDFPAHFGQRTARIRRHPPDL